MTQFTRIRFAVAVALSSLVLASCSGTNDASSVAAPTFRPSFATVPAQGTASTVDIGNWNVEWFGDPANGPTNETLQQSNVRDVIAGADLDIWGLEEGSNTAGEYIELVNVGGTDASIGGWTISDATAVRHTFAAGTMLAAGKAIVVFAGASAIPAGLTNAVAASTGALSLNNGGDSVILKSGATTADSFTYTTALSGTDGVSMNRNPDATATGTFVLHTTISTLSGSAGKRVNGTSF